MPTENTWTTVEPRRRIKLDSTESLRLLGSVPLGRVVFTKRALPTVRPVNHVLDGGDIIIRVGDGAALTARAEQGGAPGVVVAYEADTINPETHLGWSVVVVGYARLITDPEDLARCRRILQPWVDGEMDCAVRIRPDVVTGIRLAPMSSNGLA